jgi:ATP-dependent RNA helicase HelY
MLSRIFHECDLLVVEALRAGVFDGLPPEDVAALVGCLVYEHRSSDPPPAPWFSDQDVRRRWVVLRDLSTALGSDERRRGLAEHRPPDPTFAAVAHAWVVGEGFAEVVVDEELNGGDFVRTMKQVIDLLRQMALVAPDAGTRRAAASAAERADRGIVADSSAVLPERAP